MYPRGVVPGGLAGAGVRPRPGRRGGRSELSRGGPGERRHRGGPTTLPRRCGPAAGRGGGGVNRGAWPCLQQGERARWSGRRPRAAARRPALSAAALPLRPVRRPAELRAGPRGQDGGLSRLRVSSAAPTRVRPPRLIPIPMRCRTISSIPVGCFREVAQAHLDVLWIKLGFGSCAGWRDLKTNPDKERARVRRARGALSAIENLRTPVLVTEEDVVSHEWILGNIGLQPRRPQLEKIQTH